jgi:aminopeptidase N
MNDQNYDDLTPAQKAKFTRTHNHLNKRRVEGGDIHWKIFRDKQEALYEANKGRHGEAILKYQEIETEHKAIIEEAHTEMRKVTDAIDNEKRKALAPEWNQYQETTDLAHKRFLKEWKEATAELYKEFGL